MKSLLIIFLVLNLEALTRCEPLINLPNGMIMGRESVTLTGKPFYVFEKIPYAAPPIGSRRFQPPVAPEAWSGILNTTKLDVLCYQVQANTPLENEDCLYLNVYTPQIAGSGSENAPGLPVMFFIHGGGFAVGGSLMVWYGPEYLIDSDVVVVTLNYRMGPFGFLSTNDEIIPGNNGLKDQQFALNWTYNNIGLFGGDGRRITIFGQSAGSASVTYQLFNEKSQGLINGAICQSGTFISPWSYQRNARQIAFNTASYLNETFKTNNNSLDLFDFLQGIPASQLDDASQQFAQTESPENREISQGFYWAPVLEPEHPGAFISEKMYGLLKEQRIPQIPILMGINSEENLFESRDANWLRSTLEFYDYHPEWLVPNDMGITDEDRRREIGSLIRGIYVGNNQTLALNLGAGVGLFSDNSFTRSVIKFAEMISPYTDVYFYQFSYDGILGNDNTTYDGAEKVAHNEENGYIWRVLYNGFDNSDLSIFPEKDVITQQRIQEIWTNFAKYLNPTPERSNLLQNLIWPKLSVENGDFLYMNINESLSILNHPKAETYRKWVEIYDSLLFDDFDTY